MDTAGEGSGLYCYNKEGGRSSVASQTSCGIYVTRIYTFTNEEGVTGSKFRNTITRGNNSNKVLIAVQELF